ncbi:MAG TPA: bifunctional diaminohydroxyphosphoribosylaminopyrimidine deaminase/5-amino-6-(5-phosphoribosylamino)uracil reductase RibD [Verrucomicrobiae bacterium]|jgi:diaminohydroxyphosphoribosylaminopyrimidine deaminase/5-amino-6-(5-phosphoribosylamino)uracil reductase|nr:bifunctional diaminohydroxyphosphoribosylaminopyrimidine deaminase/5-amino-6-(5-phosphoribosylamino)uracil reductase RibD [Verrucomicrobiae bacterium]
MARGAGFHESWMEKCHALAELGRGAVSPNPLVGAIVVKNGREIARGHHAYYGGPHAEAEALRKAGARAKGATLYVTLEPCATWGKTPPCMQAVAGAGIKHVVIGMSDPNPANHGKGIRFLRRRGIHVTTGVLEEKLRGQNAAFCRWITTRLPWVVLKMAQSLDGKIAAPDGSSRWISSPASREWVHHLRSGADAILVGKNTVLMDDPLLSPRVHVKNQPPHKPLRVILDPRMEVSPRARVFTGEQLTLRVVTKNVARRPRHSKARRCGELLLLAREEKGRLDVKDIVCQLGAMGVAALLVEGGGETAWDFLRAGLVQKVYWVVAPKIIGGRATKTSVEGDGVRLLNNAFKIKNLTCRPLGEDWLFEGEL